ncbi:MAG: hypothetical protein PHH32_08300, partial [Eubacteriales bacterium]|nr:hypothetical protein [Eubacteriales bacterium]
MAYSSSSLTAAINLIARQQNNRCTDAKGEKTVLIGYNSNVVPVLMYGKPEHPLQQLPKDYAISPNNHSLHRKGRAKETVRITIKRDKARQQ